jgi:predicted transcriptional regulator
VAKVCLGKILKEKKMTKYRFAKLLKSEYSNVVPYFRPGYDPRLSTVAKWAQVLKISVKDLIED